MNPPARVPGPRRLLGCFRREPRPGPGPEQPEEIAPEPGLEEPEEPRPGPGPEQTRPEPGPEQPEETRPGPGPEQPEEPRPGPGPEQPEETRPGPGPEEPEETRPGLGPEQPEETRPGPGPEEPRPEPGPEQPEETRPGPGPEEPRPEPGPEQPEETRPGPGPEQPEETRPGPGPEQPEETRPGPGPEETRPGPEEPEEPRPEPGPEQPEETGPGPGPGPGPEEPGETRVALPPGEGQALEECPLCLLPQPPEAFPRLASCPHRSCGGCLERYVLLAVRESRVPVSCPHCPAALPPHDVHRLLPEPALRHKYEEFLLRRLLLADPGTRWCPAPDCSYAVFAHGCAECPRLTCGREGCGTEFCYHCRQPWHPDGPCAPAPRLASPTAQPEESAHAEAEDIKVCPRCSAFIMKINDGSCNRMNCTVCGCLFCWLCLREISDVHFLSPSGCTFWGKRPWSRTRRILWQLGMVLGAPMVISLAAGVAVPVITIGIPIYMGRKVLGQSRRSSLSGCQQCLSVTSSVLLSLFVSPIITALTVGIGVPLVLTYVYGTVVLSLCRDRGGGRAPGDLGGVELDNLAKLNELWSVLPSPRAGEDGAAGPAASLPSGGRSPRPGPAWPGGDSQSASTVALAGSMLSEGRDASDREGVTIEVEVSVEAVPRSARQQSLSSALSGQSLSGDSLGATSDRGSSVGVPVE
ncbi:E3 ubiquitin-protein ligase RNF19B-like isoform X2 [Chamaea fasciata]|uniref:E3 ubiquitin-protein ligase RNF19B-like isoform X2 n=1 Tax=Chamaea fasciata TaxID=190680 RepID=UPI00336A96FE